MHFYRSNWNNIYYVGHLSVNVALDLENGQLQFFAISHFEDGRHQNIWYLDISKTNGGIFFLKIGMPIHSYIIMHKMMLNNHWKM